MLIDCQTNTIISLTSERGGSACISTCSSTATIKAARPVVNSPTARHETQVLINAVTAEVGAMNWELLRNIGRRHVRCEGLLGTYRNEGLLER